MFKINTLQYQYPNSDFSLNLNNLEFKDAEVVAFIGSNGCGKSTFYKILSGVLTPQEYSVEIKGYQYDSLLDTPLRVSFHNAFSPLQERLTVRQNIEFYAGLHGLQSADVHIDAAAREFGITHLLSKLPGQLSSGQQHRAKLLRSLIHDPEVVLLDEPTTASDIKNIESILKSIDDLRNKGKLVFISTHHLYELSVLKPRLIGMVNGRVVFDHEWSESFSNPLALQEQMQNLMVGNE